MVVERSNQHKEQNCLFCTHDVSELHKKITFVSSLTFYNFDVPTLLEECWFFCFCRYRDPHSGMLDQDFSLLEANCFQNFTIFAAVMQRANRTF